MTYRRFAREMDCHELAEQMALDMLDAREAEEARRRADLEAEARAGLKARKAAKPRR